MSSVQAEAKTFFDLYSHGDVNAGRIDDFIDLWHRTPDTDQRSLSDYLGMTEEEYGVWVMDPETLPIIRTSRTTGRPLASAIQDYVASLKLADDPRDQSVVVALGNWLERAGCEGHR